MALVILTMLNSKLGTETNTNIAVCFQDDKYQS